MSIIPASRLSSSDLALLGNNLVPSARRKRPRSPFSLVAINRSLAGHGERVARLYLRSSRSDMTAAPGRATPAA